MKRILGALSALCCLFLLSCSSRGALVGKWRAEFYSEEVQGSVVLIYEFTDLGNLFIGSEGEDAFSLYFGSFETRGESLVIQSDDGGREAYRFQIDGQVLTLTLEETGRSTTFTRVPEE